MNKLFKSICLIAMAAMTLPMFGQGLTLTCSNGTEQQTRPYSGYDYELWSQGGVGSASMTLTGDNTNGGTFSCEWRGTVNVLSRSGKKFTNNETVTSVGNITVDFEATWSSTDNVKMLGVYGWAYYAPGSVPTKRESNRGGAANTANQPGAATTFSNQIEYYIVQDRGSYNSAKQGTNATYYGEATIDNIVYEFYVCDRIGQPMLTGNGNFKQYFSVPKNTSSHRTSGRISVSEHFKAWIDAGMKMDGSLYEVALKVESYTGNNGSARGEANVTKNILTIGATIPDNHFTLAATAGFGGTVTKMPDAVSYERGTAVRVIAVPAGGWAFDGWSGDASGADATTSVTMNANKNVTANFKVVGVSEISILKDGNFPANSIGSSWALNTGTNYGSSAATSTINGGRATINVTAIGVETYQPQLVQKGVPLEEGSKYRLTFTASATAPRNIDINIQKDGSVDGSDDYTSYAVQDFELTTTAQEFMFEFEMTHADDPAAQFAFNLGAAATGVTLSEVKLVHIAEFEPAVKVTLTFNPNGGTLQGANSINIEQGSAVGTLPTPVRDGYLFDGWIDSNNVKYTPETVLNVDATVTASWREIKDLSELLEEVSDLQKEIDMLTSETDDLRKILDECE